MLSRRSLFGFLAAAPVGAVAAVKAVAEAAPVDPPMIAVGEPILRGVNIGVGGITWVDPDYDERSWLLTNAECEQRRQAVRALMAQEDYRKYWRC